MTRKQAVLQAIEVLSKNNENKEICKVLNEILDDLPMNHWSDKAIFDAFDQFILEHNRLPNKSEITSSSKIPKHSTIKNKFGLTLTEFYNIYYTTYINKSKSRVYHYQSNERLIEQFKEQYIKNNFPTQRKYDMLREQNTPCSRHLIKLTNSKNWNEFLINCGFKVQGQNQYSTVLPQEELSQFNVSSIYKSDIDSEQLDNIKEKLSSFILSNNKN